MPPDRPTPELIFYDGRCGLCHRWVRFVIKRDADGSRFRFAPQQGPTFENTISDAFRSRLPDSVVVLTHDGRVLTKYAAAVHIMTRLGVAWRAVSVLARCVPGGVGDWVYDRIAAVRRRLFAPPTDLCPVLPPALQDRFEQ